MTAFRDFISKSVPGMSGNQLFNLRGQVVILASDLRIHELVAEILHPLEQREKCSLLLPISGLQRKTLNDT